MEVITLTLIISTVILSLAILGNKTRTTKIVDFKLVPNCLLTRWPVLFITGHRSIFYFSSYWNIYTSFLAEHGYEVFTLHLPWNRSHLRRQHFKSFLDQQEQVNHFFHIVLDTATFEEFKDIILERRSVIASLTELRDELATEDNRSLDPFPILKKTLLCQFAKNPSRFQILCHKFHSQITKQKPVPSLDTLGANPNTAISNSLRLLEHVKTLAEADFVKG